MRHIRTDIHQVGNTLAALSFGIALEQFSYLEKQHDEDCLREFVLRTRQETDAQRSQCGNSHQEVFVEGLALHQSLCSFLQRIPTH